MRLSIPLSAVALLIGLCGACNKETPEAPAAAGKPVVEKTPVMSMPAVTAVAAPKAADSNTVAASVDDVKLMLSDVELQANAMVAAHGDQIPKEQQAQAIQYFEHRLVQTFVPKTLLLNEAKRLKLTLTDEDRKKTMSALENMAKQQGVTTEELLKQFPMGEKAARAELEDGALIDKLVETEVRAKIKITDAELDAALADVQKERLSKHAEIEAIRTKLLAGTNFVELAKEVSECPSGKQSGGDLGTFTRDQMVKPFADAAFSQKIGEIGPIVETQFGYHIIKVTAHTPAQAASTNSPALPESVQASHILIKAPAAMTRDEVRKEMVDRLSEDAVQAYMKKLSEKAKVYTMFDKEEKPGMNMGAPAKPESEINKIVDTILTAWKKGEVSDNDKYLGAGRLLSPTEWEVRSIHVGVSGTNEVPKADVTVFVKSSNIAGGPIQLNWLFIFTKNSGTWQLVEVQPK